VVSIYDAMQIVWKEKVRIDLVRPTSYINHVLGTTTVTGYRGPGVEAGPMKGADWEAYNLVMPHGEFPSGSSCLCRAFANAVGAFEDMDITSPIEEGSLVAMFAKGSSKSEPMQTPTTNITLKFVSWEAVVEVCGNSRTNGGMHFTASIAEGEALCDFVGTKVGKYAQDLSKGIIPPSVPNIDHRIRTEADTRTCDSCPPGCQPETGRRLLFGSFVPKKTRKSCPVGCMGASSRFLSREDERGL
jgi:hypothetical protein